jgi:hypothetical protein
MRPRCRVLAGALQPPLRLRAMPLKFEVKNALEALPVRSMCNLYSIAKNQAAVCTENLDSEVMVMKSTKDRV